MKLQNALALEEPSFVNADGVKWWYVLEGSENKPLVRGYTVEALDGSRMYVLVDHETNAVIFETQKLEDLAVHSEILNLSGREEIQ